MKRHCFNVRNVVKYLAFHLILSCIADGVEMSAHQSGDEISSDDNNGQATFHDEAQNGDESEEMEDLTDYKFAEEDVPSFVSLSFEENEPEFPKIENILVAIDNVDSCNDELRKTIETFQDDDEYTILEKTSVHSESIKKKVHLLKKSFETSEESDKKWKELADSTVKLTSSIIEANASIRDIEKIMAEAEAKFQCLLCKISMTGGQIKTHIRSAQPKYWCQVCDKTFLKPGEPEDHKKMGCTPLPDAANSGDVETSNQMGRAPLHDGAITTNFESSNQLGYAPLNDAAKTGHVGTSQMITNDKKKTFLKPGEPEDHKKNGWYTTSRCRKFWPC